MSKTNSNGPITEPVTKDFNLMDAFRMFDYEGKGYVTSIELWQGLTMMEVTATTQDVLFFIKRYDRLETGRLRYSDFCDAFTIYIRICYA